jgi:Heterokaryon incompatibility protein (HET)
VTTNLKAALEKMRLPRRIRRVWIDAICINQEDIEERASQVRLMRGIYQNARRVVVWLGVGTAESRAAFELLRSINPSLTLYIERGDPVYTNQGLRLSEAQAKLTSLRERLLIDGAALTAAKALHSDVLAREWWKRAWIVQEAALAKDLLAICGTDQMAWDEFARCAWDVVAVYKDVPELSSTVNNDLLWISRVDAMRQIALTRIPLPLTALAACSRDLCATNPKDMIYAFLGLAADSDGELLNPNYSPKVPDVDVFTDLVEYSILWEHNLDIITLSYPAFSSHGFPSWVRDWSKLSRVINKPTKRLGDFPNPMISKFFTAETLLNSIRETSTGVVPRNCRGQWAAAGSTAAKATIVRKPNTALITTGVVVDIVSSTSSARSQMTGEDRFRSFDDWELFILRRFGTSFNDKDPLHVKPVHVLDFSTSVLILAKVSMETEMTRVDRVTKFIAYIVIYFWFIRRSLQAMWRHCLYFSIGKSYIGGGTIVDAFARTVFADHCVLMRIDESGFYDSFWNGEAPGGHEGFDRYRNSRIILFLALDTYSYNRRLIITSGGWIGLAPAETQEGDFVCVLRGCCVPVVLRKEGDHFLFVGDSYIHGLMDGLAMDRVAKGEWIEREFVLH